MTSRNAARRHRGTQPQVVRTSRATNPNLGQHLFSPTAWDIYTYWRQHDPDPLYVYLIAEHGPEGPTDYIKIGQAKDPLRRLRGLQSGNPRPLKIDGLILADVGREQRLHLKFAAARTAGEWFVDSFIPNLRAYIEAVGPAQVELHRSGGTIRDAIFLCNSMSLEFKAVTA